MRRIRPKLGARWRCGKNFTAINAQPHADDIPRITADTRVIAVDIPNTQAASALPWGSYRTTVDAIEASAGLNLFGRIPAGL